MTLQSIVDENSKTFTYDYDSVGRIDSITRSSGSNQTTNQTYTYDKADQLTQTDFGSFAHARYFYNKDGQTRLTVRYVTGGSYVLTVYKYDPVDGRLVRIEYKRSTQEPSYNDETDVINYNGGTLTALTTLQYAFDPDGRMVSKTRILFDDNGDPLRTHWCNFAYNELGRLIGESYDLGTADGQHTRSYEYDPAGNRTVKYEDGVRTDYTYAALPSQHTNQLSAASINGGAITKYLYDAMGNLTAAYVDSNGNNQFDTASEDGKSGSSLKRVGVVGGRCPPSPLGFIAFAPIRQSL